MLTLPDALRDAFKTPLGPVTTDANAVVTAAERTRTAHGTPNATLIAVGDVVTAHLIDAGCVPDVSVVDGMTERESVDSGIDETLASANVERIAVENPAATLTDELLSALREALGADGPTMIDVSGEEDLAALPAIVAAPIGSTVVYGQPGEGMVHVAVDRESKSSARELFESLDGDIDAAYDALNVPPSRR